PLSELIVISPLGNKKLIEKYEEVLKEELNVKKITLQESSEDLVTYTIKPNFRVLAPKLKSEVSKVSRYFEELEPKQAATFVKKLVSGQSINISIGKNSYQLEPNDLEYRIEVQEGFAGEESEGFLLLFNSTITDELKKEGYVRDIIRRIQTMRKELDLEYTQKIALTIEADDFGEEALKSFEEYLKEETLCTKVIFAKPQKGYIKEWVLQNLKRAI
ncbi:MAG: DUF5915 domain-containing protein, partial [Candidatus Heimdallarchaeaceae archaeon]